MICNKIPSSVCCPVKQSHIVSTILSISGLPESLVQLPVKWPYAISFWNHFVCLGDSGVLLRDDIVWSTYLQTVQRRNNDSRRLALARQFKRSEVLFRRNGGTTVLGQWQRRRRVRLLFGLTFRFDALCENNERPWIDPPREPARRPRVRATDVLTESGLAFFPQFGVTRFLDILVAEDLFQRTYDEHLFGAGPLDHINRPRAMAAATTTIGVDGRERRSTTRSACDRIARRLFRTTIL